MKMLISFFCLLSKTGVCRTKSCLVFPSSKKEERRKEVLFLRRTLKSARLSNTRRAVDKDATGTSDRDRNEGGDARG